MVDRAALEMRSTRKRTGGSNPSLSATIYTIDMNMFIDPDGLISCDISEGCLSAAKGR